MTIFIFLIDAILRGTFLYIFYQTILNKRNSILPYYVSILIYCISYIFHGLITSGLSGNTTFQATIIRLSIATLINFALCFLFRTNIKTKIFVTISYMLLITLTEELSYFLVSSIHSFDFSGKNIDSSIFSSISLISNLFMFVITMFIFLFRKKNSPIQTNIYALFLLVIPTISLCLMLSKPFFDLNVNMPFTYFILVSFVLFINLLNYIFLQNVLHTEELQSEVKILSEQIEYQKNKYQQLGESYKNIRSFMHDTKKHLFYIENCVTEKKYEEIIPYSRDTIQDLESRYCTINTGNLVIDAFVSNLLLQTKRHGITLYTNLKIDTNTVPINDYHMTIILGNFLDNALNSCLLQNGGEIKVTIQTVEKNFTIHIENTCNISEISDSSQDIENIDFIHGYGLKNAKKSIAHYDGICVIQCEKDIYSVTAIVPLQ